MIKDAARMLDVEAHVLRYWEEELGLTIKRNSMGHRYYDEKDILIFKNVQELKRRGLSLKDIRDGIEKARTEKENGEEKKNEDVRKVNDIQEIDDTKKDGDISKNDDSFVNDFSPLSDIVKNRQDKEKNQSELKVVDFKMAQLQSVMNKVIANALRENKEIITASIKEEITGDVMKQFDTVMREKEEREEKRFKKLDEYLRDLQRANMEAAAAKEKRFFRKRIKQKL